MAPLTRSQEAFRKASPETRQLIQRILQDERTVQHQKRRVLPSGEGIHEAILRHVKEAVK
jgi:hypothetical protein